MSASSLSLTGARTLGADASKHLIAADSSKALVSTLPGAQLKGRISAKRRSDLTFKLARDSRYEGYVDTADDSQTQTIFILDNEALHLSKQKKVNKITTITGPGEVHLSKGVQDMGNTLLVNNSDASVKWYMTLASGGADSIQFGNAPSSAASLKDSFVFLNRDEALALENGDKVYRYAMVLNDDMEAFNYVLETSDELKGAWISKAFPDNEFRYVEISYDAEHENPSAQAPLSAARSAYLVSIGRIDTLNKRLSEARYAAGHTQAFIRTSLYRLRPDEGFRFWNSGIEAGGSRSSPPATPSRAPWATPTDTEPRAR